MKLFVIILILLPVTAYAQGSRTAAQLQDAPFSQLTSNVPDGSVRHCINCAQTNPCSAGSGQATAQKLSGVWYCAAAGGVAAGVSSITGTANQVVASSPTGAVTLSLPQSIATTSTPQFAGIGINATAPATGINLNGVLKPNSNSTSGLQLTAANGSTVILNVDTTNNRVGVNTTLPATALDVTGAGTFSTGLTLTTGALNLTSTSGGVNLTLDSNTSAFIIDTNTLIVDTLNGRVGVGVQPTVSLDVSGVGRFSNGLTVTTGALNLTSTSGSVALTLSSSTSAFNVQSGTFVVDTTNSRAGVGTLTPDRKFEVLSSGGNQLRLTYTDSSAYADFDVGSGGNLTLAPTGDVEFDPAGNEVNPTTGYDISLGQLTKKYLALYAAELWVETLVAQNTLATIGGRILVGPTDTLIADLSNVATTIDVKYNNLSNGDRVYMESSGKVEFMAITSTASVITGGYRYSVTRNLDGTGANSWFAGDAVFDTGQAGSGFIDIYSVRGVNPATVEAGPTIVGNVRNSATYNDWSPTWAIGNLNGVYGYGVDTYGVALGKYAASNNQVLIDSTYGIRIRNGTSTILGQWDISGNIVVGQVAAGKNNILLDTSTGLHLRTNTTSMIAMGFTGDIRVGQIAASQNNITISTGAISISNNTTERVGITAGGILTIKDSSGNAVLTFDASAGAEITKKLTMPGSNSAIAIGVTPPTSASAGTGIWLDRTGLYGLLSNTVQAKMDATTGAITAAAGNVALNSTGIKITNSGSVSFINFFEGANQSGAIQSSSSALLFYSIGLSAESYVGFSSLAAIGGASSNHFGALDLHTSSSAANLILWSESGDPVSFKIGGSGSAATSAILELSSTTGALLFSRMTSTQRDALTPTNGMVIYNSTTDKLQVRAAGAWVDLH